MKGRLITKTYMSQNKLWFLLNWKSIHDLSNTVKAIACTTQNMHACTSELCTHVIPAWCWINLVSTLWIAIEIKLIQCWKYRKSEVGFSTLHNTDTTLVSSIETTLNHLCTTSMQPFFNDTEHVTSMSVKAILKPIWLVKSVDLQKDW